MPKKTHTHICTQHTPNHQRQSTYCSHRCAHSCKLLYQKHVEFIWNTHYPSPPTHIQSKNTCWLDKSVLCSSRLIFSTPTKPLSWHILNAPFATGKPAGPVYHICCCTLTVVPVTGSEWLYQPIWVRIGCAPPSVLFILLDVKAPFLLAIHGLEHCHM